MYWSYAPVMGIEEIVNSSSSVFDRNQTLFYSLYRVGAKSTSLGMASEQHQLSSFGIPLIVSTRRPRRVPRQSLRSEEHTSELQSPCNLVCRLLLEKKN